MNATRFLQHISQNKSLEAQLALTGWDTSAVIAFAASHGFTFSASELQNAIDQTWGTLSEEELRNAAGGKNDKGNEGKGKGNGGDPGASSCSFYYGG